MYTAEDIKEFMEWYGKPLPDPEHCPREVMYLYRLYQYTKTLKQQEN